MDNKNYNLPKDFWEKERPHVSLKDSLKDVTPIDWNKNNNDTIIIHSVNETNNDYGKSTS